MQKLAVLVLFKALKIILAWEQFSHNLSDLKGE